MSEKIRVLVTLPVERGELLKQLADEAGVSLAQYAGLCISIGLREMQKVAEVPDYSKMMESAIKTQEAMPTMPDYAKIMELATRGPDMSNVTSIIDAAEQAVERAHRMTPVVAAMMASVEQAEERAQQMTPVVAAMMEAARRLPDMTAIMEAADRAQAAYEQTQTMIRNMPDVSAIMEAARRTEEMIRGMPDISTIMAAAEKAQESARQAQEMISKIGFSTAEEAAIRAIKAVK